MTIKRYLRAASFGACLTLNCSLALAEASTWR
jgi:general secretion pathway protein D